MRLFSKKLLGATMLMIPLVVQANPFDDRPGEARRYHDRKYNDDHEWNGREDQAYRMWVRERHRNYVEFERLHDRDREAYWGWRHRHPDSALRIDIR